jgi:hypothetical protein
VLDKVSASQKYGYPNGEEQHATLRNELRYPPQARYLFRNLHFGLMAAIFIPMSEATQPLDTEDYISAQTGLDWEEGISVKMFAKK